MTDATRLDGFEIAKLMEEEVVALVCEALANGRGGRIITVNVDRLRGLSRLPTGRYLAGPDVLLVADGMPLVWASRIQGDPLPGRVNGTNLLCALCEAASKREVPVFLLGAPPGIAADAARNLEERYPGLCVFGTSSPQWGFERQPERMAELARAIGPMGPGIVFCALGFPKEETVMEYLSASNPDQWFVTCGGSLEMLAGVVRRAPPWMQAAGLEWLARLVQEPTRLAGRYLQRDLPYLLGLMGRSMAARYRNRMPRPKQR
jgi:N-acetylglucosaminyldiphosphoundecaprenol N-acetyl-beta-D-mannosaminyltransferase